MSAIVDTLTRRAIPTLPTHPCSLCGRPLHAARLCDKCFDEIRATWPECLEAGELPESEAVERLFRFSDPSPLTPQSGVRMPRAQHPTSDLPSLSFRPRHDRVVVKQLPLPPPDPDKLLIPDSMKKPPLEGIVRALGTHTPGLNIGDHILYAEFSGAPIVIDGEEFFVLRDEEVLGIRD